MNWKITDKKYILFFIVVVMVIGVFVSLQFLTDNNITMNVNEMVSNARKLYEKGDFENANYQLQLYCQEKPEDSQAWMLLGDLSSETGDTESAASYYKKAAKFVECSENQLGEADTIKSFKDFSTIKSIKIYPTAKYTKGMSVSFLGEDLTPKKTFSGKLVGNSDALDGNEDYITTDWFTVDDSRGSVYITGNINCAVWQFVDNKGNYEKYVDDSIFKNVENVSFFSMPYSYAQIPRNAVKARVTYYDQSVDTNAYSDDKIFISYGTTLTGYTRVSEQNFEIPNLTENQYVEYKNSKWYFFDGQESEKLDWNTLTCNSGVTVAIEGELCGTVEVVLNEKNIKKADKTLKYGIKYSTKTSVASAERLGAARGMSFDYMVGEQWKFGTGNDFDNAYPWCEMELCNVKVTSDGSEEITLASDKEFKTDGSNGNVMVRIPKFYSRRLVKDGYEYILISGTEHEGYSIEPVFVNSDGSIADYVYIGAYLGAEKDEKIVSTAESYPSLLLDYGTTLKYAENNGNGYSEMNYLMCSALQKLFIIETGTIDSSSIFAGDSYMYYNYEVNLFKNSGYAAESAKKTNTIKLYNNINTVKICEGSSITVFDGWKSYKNNDGYQREVVSVESDEKYISVTFDGSPMDIEKHSTQISNIPAKTGKTQEISYCSGTLEGEDGKFSFKYRNIENLYGSALIMLDDDAYVQDGFFYYNSGGRLNKLNTAVVEQSTQLENYDSANINMCIKEMTYDEDNPQIMLPSVVGEGATAYGYYGDVWMYINDTEKTKRYMFYGGADDNERLAGVFQLRAVISRYDSSSDFASARIMYK